MSDFVSYHKPEIMSYTANTVRDASVVTNKPAPTGIVGSRVWMLTGDGNPKDYRLYGWFTVTGFGPDPSGKWQTRIWGDWGRRIPKRNWPRLNELSWFPEFRKANGNFGLGFNEVRDPRFVRGLIKAAKP